MTLYAADRLELLLEHLDSELNKLKSLKGTGKRQRKSRRSHRRSAEQVVKAEEFSIKGSPRIVKDLKNSINAADQDFLKQKTNLAFASSNIEEDANKIEVALEPKETVDEIMPPL